MKPSLATVRLVTILVALSSITALSSAQIFPLRGDRTKARQVQAVFAQWSKAYEARDLNGTMSIFDPGVAFVFQGDQERSWTELEAGYRSDFAKGQKGRWIQALQEIYADGNLAIVSSVWSYELTVDGKTKTLARNRSMDVLRLGADKKWRIFRSMNYPEKL